MKILGLRHSLVVAFTLAGALALSPMSDLLAKETSATLDDADTAVVQSGITIPPAVKVGDRMADGTIFAGTTFAFTAQGMGLSFYGSTPPPGAGPYISKPVYVTSADAPGLYTWEQATRYCKNLIAHDRDNWQLPTEEQFKQLYRNRKAGELAGTFKTASYATDWYWSSLVRSSLPTHAIQQSFIDGHQNWINKVFEASVRCVREESIAPVRSGIAPLISP